MPDEAIDMKCPLCGKLLRAKRALISKNVRCPKCKYQFVLKDPDEEETQVMLDEQDTDTE